MLHPVYHVAPRLNVIHAHLRTISHQLISLTVSGGEHILTYVVEIRGRSPEVRRERVLFVGATNKRDDLDNAATRNGRIDKEIFVGEPDYETRVEMFKAQLDGRPHALDEKDIEKLAERTSGVVAADIEFLVNQAARNAAYGRDAERIEVKDIELQLD